MRVPFPVISPLALELSTITMGTVILVRCRISKGMGREGCTIIQSKRYMKDST